MDPFTLVTLGLGLLQAWLARAKSTPALYTVEQIARVEAAIAEIQAVHGTAVTKAQIDAGRVEMTWIPAQP